MATSLTGISPRPMLMGAPHDALRASNAGVSLRVDRLFVQVAADFRYCASAFSAVKLCAAVAILGFRMAGVTLTDSGVGLFIAVLRPSAPVVVQRIAGEEGCLIRRALGAQTADCAGLAKAIFLPPVELGVYFHA